MKRTFDLVCSSLGLLSLSPLFAFIALAVKCSDWGPVLFRQQRVGRHGQLFWILKFRTMVPHAERLGLSVTRSGDSRVTRPGRWLRASKLDELPQLWNVFKGEMSLVGPRPEVPKYVARYTPEQRRVLELKPGITDLATLEFRNEEALLSSAADTEQFYIDHCVPRKIELNLIYASRSNLWQDIKLIVRTLFSLGRSGGASAEAEGSGRSQRQAG